MMKRFNLILNCFAIVLAFASCAREVQPSGENPEKFVTFSFRAVMEGTSKAEVDEDGATSWNAGDQIAVYDAASGNFYTFTTATEEGIFTFNGTAGVVYNFTHAFYPASVAKSSAAVSLPSEVSLAEAVSGSCFPMYGKRLDGDVLSFRHLGALLKYTLIGIPETADALELSSAEVSLSGDFDLAATDPVISAKSGDGTVRIPLEPGANKSLVFYVPLPLGTYSFTCDIKEGASTLSSYSTKSAKEIERAKLIRMRPVTPTFSGGTGTESDPFLIASAEDLKTLSYVGEDDLMRSSFYKQTADIDLADEPFNPICTLDTPFIGEYDGDGHVIAHLNAQRDGANAGLFGYLKGATVKNIDIQAATVYSSANYAGAIAGVLNGGSISGCRVDHESHISTGGRGPGGIVGFVRTGTIDACASHAIISSSTDCAGGIAGYLNTNAASQSILVINCTFEPVYQNGKMAAASLTTTSTTAHMGGIAGAANATDGMGQISVVNCYAYPLEMISTQESGTKVNYIGGILGRITSTNVTLFNCLTPVTYSNIFVGGERLTANNYASYSAAASITGTVSQDGSTIRRTISKGTWPVCTYTSKNVTMSDISIKTGDSNMRGYGSFAFSEDWEVSGKRVYTQAEGGVLAALNDGVAEWNGQNLDNEAVVWEYDATFGYPKPAGIDYAGPVTRKVSIIGDSISTYEGYMFSTDDLQMTKWYPDLTNYGKYENMVMNEQETWWWKIIYGKMENARLEVDNAFGGSTVTYTETKIEGMAKDPNDRTMENSIQMRYLNYGVGNPDILIYYGGRNDFGQFGGNTDVLLGDYSTSALQSAYDAASGELFNNYAAGTVAVLRDFHENVPEGKILIVVHDMMDDGYDAASKAIAKFLNKKGYDIRCISLHEPGTVNKTNEVLGITKEGGTHPNSVGCTNIANYIYEQLGSWLESPYDPGEPGGDDEDTTWETDIENFETGDESFDWE